MTVSEDTIRVLVVDDEPDLAELTAASLERAEDVFETAVETDATAVPDRIEGYDCVVSDYRMPEQTGVDLLDAVRERDEGLPFILFTSQGSEAIASEAIARGVTDYLQKQTNEEQFELLANRVRNAVDAYRAERRNATLQRFRALHREINRALVRETDRASIEAAVCEILVSHEPYRFAWIGRPRGDQVQPTTTAGAGGDYLADVEIPLEPTADGNGPAARAFQSGTVAVSDPIATDERFAPWREAALERGFESVAAVPLSTGDQQHGLLAVYGDRPHAFDGLEQSLLGELGEDIAQALAEAALRRRLHRYERVMENLPVGVFRARPGPNGGVVDANPACAEIMGVDSVDELVGRPVREFYANPEQRAAISNRLERQGVINDAEIECERPDGEQIVVAVTAIATEEDGEVFFDGIIQDVTEQRERRKALQKKRKEVTALFERSPDAILVHDGDGTVIDANAAALSQYGYDKDELQGRHVAEFVVGSDPDDLTAMWLNMAQGDQVELEAEHCSADGTEFPVELRVTKLVFGADERFIVRASDVSERKAYEQRLQRENDRLQEFVSVVSHDLRNPLNVAMGRLSQARGTGDDEYLDAVEDALDRSVDLIDDLLALTRSGERVDDIVPVDVGTLARQCWSVVETKDATLEITIDREIMADGSRLRQLLENLFRNAVEHGGSTISLGPLDDGFYVKDDGPGIDESDRERVFEPGYSTNAGGTGLGLAIVREIIQAHGWQVEVTHSETGGARFEIRGVEAVSD